MSRSKHTDPQTIRASRRLRGPFDSRAQGDLSLRRKLGKATLESGSAQLSSPGTKRIPRLRIITRNPNPGFYHPTKKDEIIRLIEALGPVALYGLRTIEFRRAAAQSGPGKLRFGRYEASGRIVLFEQMKAPWRLPGALKAADESIFKRYGAVVVAKPSARMTVVEWPGDSLKRFMLEEVLLHELGHHVLQYHKGKRSERIARTKDHERFAALFATRQQSLLKDAGKHSK
jgi:hypothetical protein